MQGKGFLAEHKLGKVWIAPLWHILEDSTQENKYMGVSRGWEECSEVYERQKSTTTSENTKFMKQ